MLNLLKERFPLALGRGNLQSRRNLLTDSRAYMELFCKYHSQLPQSWRDTYLRIPMYFLELYD